MKVSSQTTFRYHHRLVHRMIHPTPSHDRQFSSTLTKKAYVLSKRLYESTSLHGATSQKNHMNYPPRVRKPQKPFGQSIFTWSSNITFSLRTIIRSANIRQQPGQRSR